MNTKSLSTFGIGALVLVLLGLFVKSKYSKALLVVGGLWGLANVLFEIRKVDATVTAEDPTITYSSVTTGTP